MLFFPESSTSPFPSSSSPWTENGHSCVPEIIAELHGCLDHLILDLTRARAFLDTPILTDGIERRLFHLLSQLPAECEKLGFDSLTGLPALGAFRRALDRHLRQECRRLEQHPDEAPRTTLCLFLDIDKLKRHNNVNDFAGDAAICALADVCRNILRQGDLLARTRGDQFGLLLPETTIECGIKIGDRILEGTRRVTGLALPLRCTIGLAASTVHGNTPQAIEVAAIDALATGKKRGADQLYINQFCVN